MTSVTDVELSDDEIIVLNVDKISKQPEPTEEVANSELRGTLEPPETFESKAPDAKTAE